MKRTLTAALALAFAACGGAPAKIEYPDTPEGLRQLFDDMLAAQKSGDEARAKALAESLKLPDPGAFFKETFGDEAGARLLAEYGGQPPLESLPAALAAQIAKGRTEIKVERFDKPQGADENGFQSLALKAMKKPAALYSVRMLPPGKSTGQHFYSFVHVGGTFRMAGKMKQVDPAPMSPELEALSELRMKDAKAFLESGTLPE